MVVEQIVPSFAVVDKSYDPPGFYFLVQLSLESFSSHLIEFVGHEGCRR